MVPRRGRCAPDRWLTDDGRLAFYRGRLRDGAAQILVDGGANGVQLLWNEDAAEAIAGLIETGADTPPIVEAIPEPPPHSCRYSRGHRDRG